MTTSLTLHDLGPAHAIDAALAAASPRPGAWAGRVIRVDAALVTVAAAPSGEVPVGTVAASSQGVLHTDHQGLTSGPAVGDWCVLSSDDPPRLLEILPRTGCIARESVGERSTTQVFASNVDVVVVVEPLYPPANVGRIERMTALAWNSGGTPLVVLTKADEVSDVDEQLAAIDACVPGVEVLAVSSTSGEGLDSLSGHLPAGTTLVLVGPSGAGKSTLVNALAGVDVLETQVVRGDGRGRHTTTFRELHVLPSGALVIDTPGVRSVGVAGDADSVESVFAEVAVLEGQCRFVDCEHRTEPDCAVRDAVEQGVIEQRRVDAYRKLLRELERTERRRDARLQAEWVRGQKSLTKQSRSRKSGAMQAKGRARGE